MNRKWVKKKWKINKNQVKPCNKQRHKSKLNEVVDYEEELNKSKKLENELQKDNELVYAEHYKLNKKIVSAETRYDALVEELKEELYSVIFIHQEEEYLEAE